LKKILLRGRESLVSGRQVLYRSEPPRIGGYQVLERLGEDDTGISYLCRTASGARVTLTRLVHGATIDPLVRERLQVDAATPPAPGVRFVSRVLDVGAQEDVAFAVTEFVSGTTLADRVRERGPMPGSALGRLAISTATGLAAVHQAGLVHRRINPGNVRLRPDGGYLTGLGIAPPVCPDPLAAVTAPSRAAYLAPEQVLGDEGETSADVFAWASTVVFAATGHSPFTASNPRAQMHQIVHWTPDLIAVPMPMARILELCLAKTPQDRPSAPRLLELLLGAFPQDRRPEQPAAPDTAPIQAPSQAPNPDLTSTRDQRSQPSRRRRASLALAAVALLAAAALVTVTTRLTSTDTFTSGQLATTPAAATPAATTPAATTPAAETTPSEKPTASLTTPPTTAASVVGPASPTAAGRRTTSAPPPRTTTVVVPSGRGAPAPPLVPAAFAGTWNGLVQQPPDAPGGISTTITLTAGSGTGTFHLPALGCQATLEVTGVRSGGQELTLDERLTVDPGGRCASAARLVLTLESPASLRLNWQDARDPGNTAAGVLARAKA
jgi:eukaryotic-like serine/threonine-protein kinase